MRYHVVFNDSEIPVDITSRPDGSFNVLVNGSVVDADVVELPDALSVRIGHRVLDLALEGDLPDVRLNAYGLRASVKIESERYRATASARGPKHGNENCVRSPMPGRIVKVLVCAGAVINPGDPVVIVEAMKMENELRAPKAGTISKVLVSPGDRVEGGATLLEIS